MDRALIKGDRQVISVPQGLKNHFRLQLKRQQPIRPGAVMEPPVISRSDFPAIQQGFQGAPGNRKVILQLISACRGKRKLKAVTTLNSQASNDTYLESNPRMPNQVSVIGDGRMRLPSTGLTPMNQPFRIEQDCLGHIRVPEAGLRNAPTNVKRRVGHRAGTDAL